MKEIIKHKITHNVNRLKTSLKWVVFAILSGVLVGSVGTLLYLCMAPVTLVRTKIQAYFPASGRGILIVGAYRLLHDERDTGTNLVLSAIHSGDELPLRMAPLIFISTLITHLFGGSAGREGAALQLGGSIGNGLGRLFHFDEKDKHIMIMCGMSAAFSALFGTPDGSRHLLHGGGECRHHATMPPSCHV
ncbi:MAG: chloride channel protein [Roseburia sp.]